MTFTCPWGTFSYRVLPFGLCNALATFQRVVIGIFFDLIHDCVEIYMDDFTTYGDEFNQALDNLEKTLIRCKEAHVALSNEKFQMMLTEGIVLGHHISANRHSCGSYKDQGNTEFSYSNFTKIGMKLHRIYWLLSSFH
jgi:hypothetical protein